MNPTKPLQTVRASGWFWLVSITAIIAAIVLMALPNHIWAYSDTGHYIATARQIAAGNGITTDLVYYDEQAISGALPAPQTVFPPGYPILLAGVSGATGQDLHLVARVICVLSWVLIAPLTFLLGRAVGLEPVSATISALVWMVAVMGWLPMWCYSSDMPFLAITISAALLHVTSQGRTRQLAFAGLLAACAVSIRYAGVFLGFAFGVALILQHRWRVRLLVRDGLCLIGPPLAMAVVLFARNAQIVGDWRGGNNYSVEHSVIDLIRLLYYAWSHIIGVSLDGLREYQLSAIGFFLFSLFTMVAVVVACGRTSSRKRFRELAACPASLCFVYGPISIGMLVYLEATKSSGMSPRLFVPSVPFIVISIAFLYQALCEQTRRLRQFALVAVAIGLVSFGLGQLVSLRQIDERSAKGRELAALLSQPLPDGESQTLRAFLQEHVTTSAPMLSSMPQLTSLMTDCPVVGLPVDFYNSTQEPWNERRVRERVRQYGVRYILLTKRDGTINALLPEFFSELLEGERLEWLTVLVETDEFELYEVRTQRQLTTQADADTGPLPID